MHIRRRVIVALSSLLAVIGFSMVGYRLLGGPQVSFLQALYMTIITLAGVGYGEIVDTAHNPALRVFNIFVVLIGVAITVYVFSSVTAFLVEGEIRDLFWRRKMQKKISELRHHYIICGLGDTGRYAVEELQKSNTPYVVIEGNEETLNRLRDHESQLFRNTLFIVGDATDEAILDQAGIEHATGLIAGLSSDKENLVITVMARQKSPNLRIVARCSDVKFSERMSRAGANSTVSPSQIGGMRLASEVLRPHVVGFLDMMLKDHSRTLRIEEIDIHENSPWASHPLGGVDFRHAYNLVPLALKNPDTNVNAPRYLVNPADSVVLTPGSVVIVMGDIADVQRARHAASAKHAAGAGA